MAGVEADEELETATLLGSAFAFINIHPRRSSFLATALLDLAAFSGDPDLYTDMVSDVMAALRKAAKADEDDPGTDD